MQVYLRPPEAGLPERRREQRHQVERTCQVMTAGAAGPGLAALTLNISRSGMLLRFPRSMDAAAIPKAGAFIRVLVELPAPSGREPRSLECTGRILREVLTDNSCHARAMQIDSMKVLAASQDRGARQRRAASKVN